LAARLGSLRAAWCSATMSIEHTTQPYLCESGKCASGVSGWAAELARSSKNFSRAHCGPSYSRVPH
jgi:hypothetical protein